MSATALAAPEVTVYQAAWDERQKKHNRFARLVNYGFLTVFLGIVAWSGIVIFNQISIMSSPTDLAGKQDAARMGGVWFAGFAVTTLFIGAISVPFFRAVGWSKWALGERPTDDFKPREAKPIGVTIEQVNEDLRYFHVSGLYRPDENYTFKVERLTDKRLFHQPVYSYRLIEEGNKMTLHCTFDSSCFTGMTEAEITKYLIDTISFQLEDQTNHFKELNYAI